MNVIQNWMLSKLPFLVPCQLPDVISGTSELSLNFKSNPDYDDPLSNTIHSMDRSHKISKDDLRYSILKSRPEIQFVKRLQDTPYYISCLVDAKFTLYVIDFYTWAPVTTIYRIFYFQSMDQDIEIELNLPEQVEMKTGNRYQIKDWNITSLVSSRADSDSTNTNLLFTENDLEEQCLVFALSKERQQLSDLSVVSLLNKFNQLQEDIKKSHILTDLKIQDTRMQRRIDEMWHRQKGINPERQTNNKFDDLNVTDIWAIELCHYMGWKDPQKKQNDLRLLNL